MGPRRVLIYLNAGSQRGVVAFVCTVQSVCTGQGEIFYSERALISAAKAAPGWFSPTYRHWPPLFCISIDSPMARLREKQPNGVPLSRKNPEAADPQTDPSRWRLLDEQGRQTWHYLQSDEEIKEWPQSIADRYFLGLPTVRSFRGPVI